MNAQFLLTVVINNNKIGKRPVRLKAEMDIEYLKKLSEDIISKSTNFDNSQISNSIFRLLKLDNEWSDWINISDKIRPLDKVKICFDTIEAAVVLEDLNVSSVSSNMDSPRSSSTISKHSIANQDINNETTNEIPINYRKYLFQASEAFDIRMVLNEHCEGPEILSKFHSSLDLHSFDLYRKRLLRISCKWLMNNCSCVKKPTAYEKAKLAFSIVQCFPQFSSKLTVLGYEHLFDPVVHKGFIESAIHNMRSNDKTIEKRHYNKRAKLQAAITDTEVEKTEIKELVHLRPIDSSVIRCVKEKMNNLRESRQEWIKNEQPTLTQILQKYPRFLDTPNLVLNEFKAVLDEKELHLDLCSIFEQYAPLIAKELLQKREKTSAHKVELHMIDVSDGDDFDELTFDESTDLTKAVELIVATFFAFNIAYPPSLIGVYQFFECIFGLTQQSGTNLA